MSKKINYLFLGLLIVGLAALPVFAEIGLQQILSEQGVSAVGTAVKTAAEAVYASTDDPAEINAGLVAILNEAEATGDESVITYAIVAVMLAGGVENLEISKEAVNDSNMFANHPEVTAFTVAATEELMLGGGSGAGGQTQGGGGAQKGGSEGGGADDPTLGGGDPEVFDPDSDTESQDIRDEEKPATPV